MGRHACCHRVSRGQGGLAPRQTAARGPHLNSIWRTADASLGALTPADRSERVPVRQQAPMVSKCRHWTGLACEGAAPKHWLAHVQVYIPESRHELLMRFRMSCWPLRANQALGLPRMQSLCPLCNGEVEDEERVLMLCHAYDQVRPAAELPSTTYMLALMKVKQQDRLACLLSEIWSIRNSQVRVPREGMASWCVRSCFSDALHVRSAWRTGVWAGL